MSFWVGGHVDGLGEQHTQEASKFHASAPHLALRTSSSWLFLSIGFNKPILTS